MSEPINSEVGTLMMLNRIGMMIGDEKGSHDIVVASQPVGLNVTG